MLKATAHHANGTLLFFGLSEENVKRLKEDKLIKFSLTELGIPGVEVIIFYGSTEEIMETQLAKQGLISKETRRCAETKPNPNSSSSRGPSAESG